MLGRLDIGFANFAMWLKINDTSPRYTFDEQWPISAVGVRLANN